MHENISGFISLYRMPKTIAMSAWQYQLRGWLYQCNSFISCLSCGYGSQVSSHADITSSATS